MGNRFLEFECANIGAVATRTCTEPRNKATSHHAKDWEKCRRHNALVVWDWPLGPWHGSRGSVVQCRCSRLRSSILLLFPPRVSNNDWEKTMRHKECERERRRNKGPTTNKDERDNHQLHRLGREELVGFDAVSAYEFEKLWSKQNLKGRERENQRLHRPGLRRSLVR